MIQVLLLWTLHTTKYNSNCFGISPTDNEIWGDDVVGTHVVACISKSQWSEGESSSPKDSFFE